ncbi:MAG: type II secretion system protein N [Candidatus Aceula lacicola]|nr:type II secretion system protein N [Candidatus Aceula lacicola]
MAKKETAEQKLLKIIEGDSETPEQSSGEQTSDQSQQVAQEVASAVKGTGVSAPPIFSAVLDRMRDLQIPIPSLKSLGLREANFVLMVMIIFSVLILGSVYQSETKNMSNNLNFVEDVIKPKIAKAVSIMPEYQNLASFLETILTRNIFRPYEEKESEVANGIPLGTQKIALKLEKLKLVGISWLDMPNSASAMVENADGMTYFLKEGENINQVTIKAIYADRVVFSFEDQEMEIRL